MVYPACRMEPHVAQEISVKQDVLHDCVRDYVPLFLLHYIVKGQISKGQHAKIFLGLIIVIVL